MRSEIRDILEAAEAKLKAADMLLRENLCGDAASRAYYAAFHALGALHFSRGNTFSSHAQLIGRFNRDFVRTGLFPREFTRIMARLFEDRQSGDYDIVHTLTQEEARQEVDDARRVVEAVSLYLQSLG